MTSEAYPSPTSQGVMTLLPSRRESIFTAESKIKGLCAGLTRLS